jgi:peroxiredoxin
MHLRTRNPLAACLALALLLPTTALSAQSCSTEQDPATHTEVGGQMPAFTVTEPDGTQFALASQRGKIVVINFWATWCGPCQSEIPRLEKEVWQKYKGNPRFSMVAIAREQTEADIVPFRKKSGFSFPIASVAGVSVLRSTSGGATPKRSTYKLFADSGIPRTYVVDRSGKILFQTVGYCPDAFDGVNHAIDQALAQPAN